MFGTKELGLDHKNQKPYNHHFSLQLCSDGDRKVCPMFVQKIWVTQPLEEK